MQVSEESVCALVRLAWASEASKRPLKKEDIISLVLGENGGRLFRPLLQKTNEHLSSVFSVQLVPLPAAVRAGSTQTVAGRRAANAAVTRRMEAATTSATASTSFVLQTVAERPLGQFHRQPDRLALLAIVLCLIHLSEGQGIEEDVLLERLGALGVDAHFGELTEWLAELKRQKYLLATKKNEEATIAIYSAGPRAMVEFPVESLARFVLDLGRFVQRSAVDLAPRLQAAFRVDPSQVPSVE